uniref:Cyclin-dependent kinase inhibitor domain-containing protein n=1 Tax=Panagrolaimus superbus TaxID=310955 RepID=A0A914Y5R0_9BILA
MPRESIFRRTAIQSHARRRLFADDDIDHNELNQRLQSQLDEEVQSQSRRWGFDFHNDIPMQCDSNENPTTSSSTTSTETTFIYETLNANEVPVIYRSNTIVRKEIPRVGMVEIKHYTSGRGPIESPTKSIQPTKSAENTRKRRLPTPSTTPMKLRKRASPHKTPVNPGPKPHEHSTSSASKRPRRNLTEKFKASASAVPPHSTSSEEDSSK